MELCEKVIALFVDHLMTLGFDDYESALMRQEHHILDFSTLPAMDGEIDEFHFSLMIFEKYGVVHDLKREGKRFAWRIDQTVLDRMAVSSFVVGRA